MDPIKNALAPLLEQLGKLSARARGLLALVAGAGVMVALALLLTASGPDRLLFSNLDPRDAASVVGALDGAKIAYSLEGGGTTVRVFGEDVDRARIVLAEQDLPKTGNVGFELFEDQSFGITDFAQQVNYRRALQGELERTITQIDAIANARVHITTPSKAVFEDEKVSATASVTIDLVRGRDLPNRSVGAIRHLVASAVEGLEAGAVTVVDTKGNLLSRAGSGDDTATASLDYEHDLERALEQRLSRLLERTVGVGGAEVQVAAEVDFSRTDTTEEVYDPEQTAIRSESSQEALEGQGARGGAGAGGVAGAAANVPGAAGRAGAPGRGGSSRIVSSKQYEVNRTVVRTVGAGATVKRLTVAVLVDGTYTTPEDGGEPVFTPRTDEELAQLQGIVENAIGFNETRGDRIKLASVPFLDRPVIGDLGPPPEDAFAAYLPYGIGGGVLLVAGVGWFLMRRRKSSSRPVVEPDLLTLPATVEQAQAALRGDGTTALAVAQQGALAAAATQLPSKDEVLALAAADPERTADVVRGWILSDQT